MVISVIPQRVMEATDLVTRKHPNSLDVTIYRKVLKRKSDDTMGGLPTLGGLGILTPDDEDEFEYKAVGDGRMLITTRFDGEMDTTDREDAFVPDAAMVEANITPEIPGAFVIHKYDLVAAMPGGGVVIGYEIMKLPTTTNIYPYTTKYVIAPRDDLNNLTPWQG